MAPWEHNEHHNSKEGQPFDPRHAFQYRSSFDLHSFDPATYERYFLRKVKIPYQEETDYKINKGNTNC